MLNDLNDFIFSSNIPFTGKAIKVFQFQYQHNELYKRFADALNCNPGTINNIHQIPFLPISFFKTHAVTTTTFEPQLMFESSGTTGSINSRHFVKDASIYELSFCGAFKQFYGPIQDYCILGLLPSYLERKNSSLVYMVDKLMQISGHPLNGFHLYDHKNLFEKLKTLEKQGQKTILFGVTYALLDFAQAFSIPLKHTVIIETGGMKGRKHEMLRSQVHRLIKEAFRLTEVHSEYGMTELLSQAYALKEGIFQTPPWMKILIRAEDDPLQIHSQSKNVVTGAIDVIDLSNIYSCSFIATDDAGKLYPDGSFEVLGRIDNSDIRGCSLMAV
jgi:phenylacetate-coenzyme A ligase PaaK-like adenylate-forming protein